MGVASMASGGSSYGLSDWGGNSEGVPSAHSQNLDANGMALEGEAKKKSKRQRRQEEEAAELARMKAAMDTERNLLLGALGGRLALSSTACCSLLWERSLVERRALHGSAPLAPAQGDLLCDHLGPAAPQAQNLGLFFK